MDGSRLDVIIGRRERLHVLRKGDVLWIRLVISRHKRRHAHGSICHFDSSNYISSALLSS